MSIVWSVGDVLLRLFAAELRRECRKTNLSAPVNLVSDDLWSVHHDGR